MFGLISSEPGTSYVAPTALANQGHRLFYEYFAPTEPGRRNSRAIWKPCAPRERADRGTQPPHSSAKTSAFLAVRSVLITGALYLFTASARAQEPSPSPQQQTLNVPPIATDYRANPNKPLPPLNRVGVDAAEQKPLALREAIELAMQNNKDIE